MLFENREQLRGRVHGRGRGCDLMLFENREQFTIVGTDFIEVVI